ncbi:MAG: hypothetical protein WKF55_10870 [Gemmatimonadaceae bacterium]
MCLCNRGLPAHLYEPGERRIIEYRIDEGKTVRDFAEQPPITPHEAAPLLAAVASSAIDHPVTIIELARRHGVALGDLLEAAGAGENISSEAVLKADLEIRYEGYSERERAQAERMKQMGDFALTAEIPYDGMQSLSFEARQKLGSIQPRTLGQAARIPGVSPSDIQNLLIELERGRRKGAVG